MTYIPELSGSQALGAGEIRDRYPNLAWTTKPMRACRDNGELIGTDWRGEPVYWQEDTTYPMGAHFDGASKPDQANDSAIVSSPSAPDANKQ